MHQQRTATVKVGLLTVISLAVLITTVIWLRGRTLGGGQSYEIFYKDVDGLRDGAPVQFMGIRVGFIDEVKPTLLQNKLFRVRVKFTITDSGVNIPKGSQVTLEQSGIIGEKFIEITPPRPQFASVTLLTQAPGFRRHLPIQVAFREGMMPVGRVLNVRETQVTKIFRKTPDYQYRFNYLLDQPGYLPPGQPRFEFVRGKNGQDYLRLLDGDAVWLHQPDAKTYFTLEEPLRIKEFLEEQLASAQALQRTNDKINDLLSDETIASIQGTLKNSERLTAQATSVLSQANTLFANTTYDLKALVQSTQRLTDSVVAVSANVNDIAGNPEVKTDIQTTVRSVRESTQALAQLLNDPSLKQTLGDVSVTSQNAAELVAYLKQSTIDNDLQAKLNTSLTLLNSSLTKLSGILEDVEAVSDDKATLQQILQDTRQTSQNLNRFSQRLNKRFLLFRLLF